MIFEKKIWQKFLTLLLISVGAIMLSFLISINIKKFNQPEKVTKRFSAEISKSESQLLEEINIIKSDLKRPGEEKFSQIVTNFKPDYIANGRIYLVYLKDSLKIWTSNSFPAPEFFDNTQFSRPLLIKDNGYYLHKEVKDGDYRIVGLQLLKYRYKFSNEYLPQGFFKKFQVPNQTEITTDRGKFEIRTANGNHLCSLKFDSNDLPSKGWMFTVAALFIIGFLFLVYSLFIAYQFFIHIIKNRWLLMLFFVLDVVLLRALQFYFKFPAGIYDLDLFSPVYFASSDLLPSLGDLLLNIVLALELTYILFKNLPVKNLHPPKYRILSIIINIGCIGLIISLYEWIKTLVSGLVLNSDFSMQLNRVESLSSYSVIGLIIIVCAVFIFLFISETLSRIVKQTSGKKTDIISGLSVASAIYIICLFYNGSLDLIPLIPLLALFVVFYFITSLKESKLLSTGEILLSLFILAIYTTYLLNSSTVIKEHEHRKIIAIHLADPRDQQAEYYYKSIKSSIEADKTVRGFIESDIKDSISENKTINYIKKQYFSGYFNKYDVLITICHPGKFLNVNPGNLITDCDKYFSDHIKQDLRLIDSCGLYFLNRSIDVTYYLGVIALKTNGNGSPGIKLYLELNSKNANKGLGYPELLMDRSLPSTENLTGYSYAFYNMGELIRNVGSFSYNIKDPEFNKVKGEFRFINSNAYSHLIHRIDENTILVVSYPKQGITDVVTPFSFVLIFLLLLLLLFVLISGAKDLLLSGEFTFQIRLQILIVALVVISSILIGGITLIYLKRLNYNKNKDIVSEKMNTVLVDMENRYGNSNELYLSVRDEINTHLLDLSNAIFTDINVYGTNGELIATTRYQVFEEGLLGEKMDPIALSMLSNQNRSFYIQNEKIGNYKFLSAYAPLRNMNNKQIGFLNLPYFARQQDIRQELSKLLATYADIFIIIIAIAILMALIVSRYMTRPLQLIREQLRKVKLGTPNEKITWSRRDEIGSLIDEYNRMIDELTKSAELLAKSERETAWREMARQVAHEIKNPLTPIKLSMQHLLKAWDDHSPDWDDRLKKFSQTLILQIDTLSAIASEFSDFAQMPLPKIKLIEIEEIIHISTQLFKDQENITIQYPRNVVNHFVYADENQMLRVFNNLIKNSLQSIPSGQKGLINIGVEEKGDKCLITVTDNGCGIPAEQQTKIFSPNFTTKSAGMGLGLAMVKNIIDNSGGEIWFESKENEGTRFFILLPSIVEG